MTKETMPPAKELAEQKQEEGKNSESERKEKYDQFREKYDATMKEMMREAKDVGFNEIRLDADEGQIVFNCDRVARENTAYRKKQAEESGEEYKNYIG